MESKNLFPNNKWKRLILLVVFGVVSCVLSVYIVPIVDKSHFQNTEQLAMSLDVARLAMSEQRSKDVQAQMQQKEELERQESIKQEPEKPRVIEKPVYIEKNNNDVIYYKAKFAEDCNQNYSKAHKDFENAVNNSDDAREYVSSQKRVYNEFLCQRIGAKRVTFDITSIWYCDDGVGKVHSRDNFVKACIDWRMDQIDL